MHTDCEIPTQSFFVCSQSTEGVFKKYQFHFPLGIQDQDRLSTQQSTQNHDICTETFWGEIVDNPGMKNARNNERNVGPLNKQNCNQPQSIVLSQHTTYGYSYN